MSSLRGVDECSSHTGFYVVAPFSRKYQRQNTRLITGPRPRGEFLGISSRARQEQQIHMLQVQSCHKEGFPSHIESVLVESFRFKSLFWFLFSLLIVAYIYCLSDGSLVYWQHSKCFLAHEENLTHPRHWIGWAGLGQADQLSLAKQVPSSFEQG